MKITPVTVNERVALCNATATINGRPARVSGWGKDFATVTDMTLGLSCQFAWQTVALVVSKGGAFKS